MSLGREEGVQKAQVYTGVHRCESEETGQVRAAELEHRGGWSRVRSTGGDWPVLGSACTMKQVNRMARLSPAPEALTLASNEMLSAVTAEWLGP